MASNSAQRTSLESVVDSRTLDNLRRCIKESHQSMYSKISDAVENNMKQFTKELYSKKIIAKAVMESQNYSQVTHEFSASLSFRKSIQEIETECLKFLESLQAIGGPAELAAEELGRKWNEDVHKKLDISFLLSYSSN